MKNNKGFSILELIVSFSLTMVIMVVLFEIIVYMKELYEKSVTQTELLNRQNLITDYIYTDLASNNLVAIDGCGDNCINFIYSDERTKQLTWDLSFGSLRYDEYTLTLIGSSSFNKDEEYQLTYGENNKLTGVKICYNSDSTNAYVSIKLPINNSLFPNIDFGLNIFYTYNDAEVYIDLPKSSDC